MGKPKKRTSARRTGSRRSHLVLKLARAVNAKSPVKVFTTRKESGKALSAVVKPAKKPTRPAETKPVKV
jgi:ribosomal protein L32